MSTVKNIGVISCWFGSVRCALVWLKLESIIDDTLLLHKLSTRMRNEQRVIRSAARECFNRFPIHTHAYIQYICVNMQRTCRHGIWMDQWCCNTERTRCLPVDLCHVLAGRPLAHCTRGVVCKELKMPKRAC